MIEQKIKKNKKQVIIEEAATLIREKGYTATTMRDIAAKVGIEAASLYNHIKSKEQILAEICFSLAEGYTLKMKEIEPSPQSPIEKIKELLTLHIEINAMSSPLASVMNDEWRHLSEPKRSEFLNLRKMYENKFIDIIQEGIDQKQLASLNANIALYTMLSSIRWLQHWYHSNRELNVDSLKTTITELILNGITKK